ncbi:hypothetical protein [Qipengyuania sphaerica]|uniref:hypothetical protein n=1 Tax=Qipengyuania sphaerica TaxID=2867243 RepID=UPI001C8835A2|nr:hypothetical protein [Qipengyuania sphaerica]MBX7540722.1 hypothetical protein [Qipengyuania sphaerica]
MVGEFLTSRRKAIRRKIFSNRRLAGLHGIEQDAALGLLPLFPVILAASLGHVTIAWLLMVLIGIPGLAYGIFVIWTGFRAYAEREDRKYERHTKKHLPREYNEES